MPPSCARGIEPYGGPRKTGMQPAMKISLVLRAEALSPGSTRQKSVLFILSMTCACLRTWSRDSGHTYCQATRGRAAPVLC